MCFFNTSGGRGDGRWRRGLNSLKGDGLISLGLVSVVIETLHLKSLLIQLILGLPCTIFIFVLPPLLGACLFGTLYPFVCRPVHSHRLFLLTNFSPFQYIIMATRASPTPRLNRPAAAPESLKEKDENGGVWPYRIPVFALSLFLSNHVVRFLCGRRRKGRVA